MTVTEPVAIGFACFFGSSANASIAFFKSSLAEIWEIIKVRREIQVFWTAGGIREKSSFCWFSHCKRFTKVSKKPFSGHWLRR